ncbi:cobalamin biosynthesis protein CbiX [Escherichia coli]|uniref:cobalamin biosynthesis protein CbiX n=1 Tax=Escherichia coli TaxID=562 RepID=UPI0032174F52
MTTQVACRIPPSGCLLRHVPLPWFIVRAGYRDLVQITCACVSILGLCAATGVFSYFDNKPLAFLYGCGALACFLYAVDCAIPLYMTRKKPRKQL